MTITSSSWCTYIKKWWKEEEEEEVVIARVASIVGVDESTYARFIRKEKEMKQ